MVSYFLIKYITSFTIFAINIINVNRVNYTYVIRINSHTCVSM